jgi:hypothetical protein
VEGRAVKRALREAAILAAFVALTALMTWPWLAHVRDTSFDPGDSYLNSWILAWDAHQTLRDPLHLFDANIFYPYRDTLALSDHQWGTAMLFLPATLAGLPPLTVHSLAILFAFALSGYGAFRLARTLTGSTPAGWVAGVAFAFVPYRFHHIPHLHIVMTGWMALVAEAVVLFGRERSWRRAAWLGAVFFVSGVSSVHWFVLGLVPAGIMGVAGIVRTQAGERRAWVRAAAALAAASLALVPFFLPYMRAGRQYGFRRDISEVATYSARPIHWITPDWNLRLWKGMGENPPQGEFCLFPGFLLLALAGAGVALAVTRRDTAARTGLLWAALGFAGSFGTRTPFHVALYYALPVFQAIRAPVRWAMVADLGFAVLAGTAAAALASRFAPASRGGRAAIGACVCALLLFEDRVAPMALHRGEPDADALSRALAATPMRGGLWQLPDDFGETNARYVLRSADHWKPLVNAYSGFQTPLAAKLHGLLLAGEPAPLLDALEGAPVSYVTVRRAGIPEAQAGSIRRLLADGLASGRLRFVRRFRPGDDLFAVVKTEPQARSFEILQPVFAASRTGPGGGGELTGSIDVPAAGATVRGTLTVSGWARMPGEDLAVSILVDGEERPVLSFERFPRPDVQAAVPRLGDCSRAGYRATLALDEGDDGPHEVAAVFRTADGRERPYGPQKFDWKP